MMKRILLTATLAFAMLVISDTALQAQRGNWNQTPEERATQQSALMRDSLALSDAQYEKVYELNLYYARKMQELRNDADGDRAAMREQFEALRQAQNDALRKVLTAEQFEKWQQIQQQRMNRRRPGDGPPRRGGNR